jgi:hypothetical protein
LGATATRAPSPLLPPQEEVYTSALSAAVYLKSVGFSKKVGAALPRHGHGMWGLPARGAHNTAAHPLPLSVQHIPASHSASSTSPPATPDQRSAAAAHRPGALQAYVCGERGIMQELQAVGIRSEGGQQLPPPPHPLSHPRCHRAHLQLTRPFPCCLHIAGTLKAWAASSCPHPGSSLPLAHPQPSPPPLAPPTTCLGRH